MSAALQAVKGDITRQPDIDIIVNAANAALSPGSGVSGAIHTVAGPGLREECRLLAPIAPGEVVITGAHELPNSYVIHCLGPVWGQDKPEAELLRRCYVSALRLAQEKAVASIAFPAISTGIFGYPADDAARVAVFTVRDALASVAPGLELVRFVLFDDTALRIYRKLL